VREPKARYGTRPSGQNQAYATNDQVRDQHGLNEQDDENDDDRRNIDAAKVWEGIADRPQDRLGDPIKKLRDGRDYRIARIDHIERDEPAQDSSRDQNVDIELQEIGDECE
jgi:hypothetical protein